ncbi:hypothetical protein BDY19DRAFT_519526 [Irpex rosettiformis]|uniref:Uncharacterized protein n=1 Tax=Irpex rosettiformis TaxID=378272 RepID=A0ACB8TRS7_9APHY|nr:hypothetical protein BDY19DRAFT_519526 [Irpex rosettiformis]
MFKFDFDIEEDPEIDSDALGLESQDKLPVSSTVHEDTVQNTASVQFTEHTLDELLETIPSTGFSFSPLQISSGRDALMLPRRDLFDARFQLIAASAQTEQEQDQELEDLKFVEAPSDLIPGVYEGGLKTWECSVDLAAYLHESLPPDFIVGKRVLELGCGTAVPSMYLLRQAFSHPPNPNRQTSIHLQDYNELVFRLAVLPSIILTWYMSPASTSFRESQTPTTSETDDTLPPADSTQPGDLPITPSLLSAFRHSLSTHNIELHFFSGSWETFDLERSGGKKYDIVLTSETIYSLDSLPSLLDLMWQASSSTQTHESVKSLEDLTKDISLTSPSPSKPSQEDDEFDRQCVVAAKLVYFGVGGGVTEFIDAVENARYTNRARCPGRVETVWNKDEGVKRVIMKVKWR